MRLVRLAALASALSLAQPDAHARSPYAGEEGREIKALSAQRIDDLRAGRGMGYALAAELNGYPGPMHVLELADALGLDARQRSRVSTLVAEMRAEARAAGEALIASEARLDRLFADRKASPPALRALVQEAAAREAAVREAHLRYHLETAALLRPEQRERYQVLRGYATGAAGSGPRHGEHHGHRGPAH